MFASVVYTINFFLISTVIETPTKTNKIHKKTIIKPLPRLLTVKTSQYERIEITSQIFMGLLFFFGRDSFCFHSAVFSSSASSRIVFIKICI